MFDYLLFTNFIDSNVGQVRQETVKILHANKRFLLDASYHSWRKRCDDNNES